MPSLLSYPSHIHLFCTEVWTDLLCVLLETDIAQKVLSVMSSTSRQTTSRSTTKKSATSARTKKTEPVVEAAQEPEAKVEVIETEVVSVPVVNPFLTDMVCAFDSAWYVREYPDVAAAGFDAATHYRESGYREGRQPNRFFSPHDYRAANPDLAEYEGDLFLHFIFYGIKEGRRLR